MKQSKSTHQFTLILKNVDANTPHLEDSLYEAGCDDALINYRNSAVYLDFARKSLSFEDAVMQAIQDVESASVGAIVAGVAPETLVTETDIAKRTQVKRQTVSLWIKGERRRTKPFPKPIMKLSDRSPLWRWREIAEWLYQNHLINNKEYVTNATFIENINAILEERNSSMKKVRQALLRKFEKHIHPHH